MLLVYKTTFLHCLDLATTRHYMASSGTERANIHEGQENTHIMIWPVIRFCKYAPTK